jgi:hypothetical protein
MQNYTESKKVLDKIAAKYSCAGNLIMKVAFQDLLKDGQKAFQNEEAFAEKIKQINDYHDEREANGKIPFITRSLDMAFLNCTKELAEISTYDLLIYIQKEMYWSLEGGLDYQKAIKLLTNLMDCIVEHNGEDEVTMTYNAFKNAGFSNDELVQLGYGYLILEDEEE